MSTVLSKRTVSPSRHEASLEQSLCLMHRHHQAQQLPLSALSPRLTPTLALRFLPGRLSSHFSPPEPLILHIVAQMPPPRGRARLGACLRHLGPPGLPFKL